MSKDIKTQVSKYVSYLLRHNPENLKMDREGFVPLDELLTKIKTRYPVADRKLLMDLVRQSDKKRFEMVGDCIRALYGHTIDVNVNAEEDTLVTVLFHGTTPQSAREIMETGLKPMRRKWVHLSPTKEIAIEVGRRRASAPAILSVDASLARRDGVKFYKVTNKVYLCEYVPSKYISMRS